jgi:hypothetical protein
MDMLANVSQNDKSPFDAIRKFDNKGAEYWSARDLMAVLGYVKWQNFKSVVDNAIENIETVTQSTVEHFLPLEVKSQGRPCLDYKLSRLACYHIALCCDSRGNDAVKLAKHYFAVKTRQAELAETKPALPKSSQFIEPEVINTELMAIKFFTENGDLQLAQLAKVHLGNRYLASQQKLLKPANIPQYEGAVDVAIRLGFKVPKNYEGSLGSHVKTRHGHLTVGKDNRYSLASGKQIPANMYPFGDPDIEKTVLDYCISKSFYHQDIEHVA